MSRRVPRAPAVHVAAAVVAGEPGAATPTIPSTEPLPSDQTDAPRVAPAAPVLDPLPIVETTPLPSPTTAPADPVDRVAGARMEFVPGTVPLPSDQLTPVRAVDGTTDASATTDAAIALETGVNRRDEAGHFHREMDGVLYVGEEGERQYREDMARRDWPFASAGREWAGSPSVSPSEMLDTLEGLRRDLEAAGFGVVTLSTDTVTRLRVMLNLPQLTAATPEQTAVADQARLDRLAEDVQPRRTFTVEFDVDHDGQKVPPGGAVSVTRADFERLRAGTAIASATEWADGLA